MLLIVFLTIQDGMMLCQVHPNKWPNRKYFLFSQNHIIHKIRCRWCGLWPLQIKTSAAKTPEKEIYLNNFKDDQNINILGRVLRIKGCHKFFHNETNFSDLPCKSHLDKSPTKEPIFIFPRKITHPKKDEVCNYSLKDSTYKGGQCFDLDLPV